MSDIHTYTASSRPAWTGQIVGAIRLVDGGTAEHDRLVTGIGDWLRRRDLRWQWRREHPDTPWRRG